MKLRRVPSRTTRTIASSNNNKMKKPTRKKIPTKYRKCVCMPQNISPIEFPPVWTEFRLNNQLCDGIVKCEDGKEFKIHRAILSAVSPYFKVFAKKNFEYELIFNNTFRRYLRIQSIEDNRKILRRT